MATNRLHRPTTSTPMQGGDEAGVTEASGAVWGRLHHHWPDPHRDVMVQTIIVPIDRSEFSATAVPAAAALSRAIGATVHLVGVTTDFVYDTELVSRMDEARDLLSTETGFHDEMVEGVDPVTALLEQADNPGVVLCLASHDHLPLAASIRHSVGSLLIERAVHPLLVVGANADATAAGDDVVVAVDGIHDPSPLLGPAARWAAALNAPLRIVTVFEPVCADIRDPDHYTRAHGPSSDPLAYLDGVRSRLGTMSLLRIDVVAIPDPVSVPVGLADHLATSPARILVAGGRPGGFHLWPGVVRELLRMVPLPVLVIPAAKEPVAHADVAAGQPLS